MQSFFLLLALNFGEERGSSPPRPPKTHTRWLVDTWAAFTAWFLESPSGFSPQLNFKSSTVPGRNVLRVGTYCRGGVTLYNASHVERHLEKL